MKPAVLAASRPVTTSTPACTPALRLAATGGYDILAETLRSIRLTGSVFLNARFSKPFGIISPDKFDPATPLANLRHVSIFHLIASGSCTIEIQSGERHVVSAGDILLLPFAAAHKLWNGDGQQMASAPDLMQPGPIEGLWTLDHGGGGETTRMVCGYVESSEFLHAPVFRSLPPLLVDHTGEDRVSALINTTVREILLLADSATPGTEMLLGRLMELLFVEVVRRYAARLPATAKGWFAACNDAVVGRALRAIHRDASRRWTVADLAREAGASRSVLSERFAQLIGQPPIEYLANWRMQLATERLRTSTDSLAGIAAEVGYESEAAFNRAFKRITGLSPGRWRDVEAAAHAGGAVQAAPGFHL